MNLRSRVLMLLALLALATGTQRAEAQSCTSDADCVFLNVDNTCVDEGTYKDDRNNRHLR